MYANDSMFSVRHVPFYGQTLDHSPRNAAEALTAAGLDWTVEDRKLYTLAEFGDETIPMPVETHKAIVRTDTNANLGVVGSTYKSFQNAEMAAFLDDLLATDSLVYESGGTYRAGRDAFLLVRKPDFIEVGGDAISTFVFVAMAHDGTRALTAFPGAFRILCGNALRARIGKAKAKYALRHTRNADISTAYQDARNVLGMTVDYEARFKAMGDALALDPFTSREMQALTAELFPIDADAMTPRQITMRTNARESLVDIFNGNGPDGDTRGNAPGTRWTAYNAVGEYADHVQRRTGSTEQIERSMADSPVKDRALALLTA